MSPQFVGWLSVGVLFVLLALRVPVAPALAVAGVGGYALLSGPEAALHVLGTTMYARIAIYSFSVIPLFIIMGHLAYQAGIVAELFNTAQKWFGGWPGGLAQATMVGGAAFGAACGSGAASVAVLGKIAIPEMMRHGAQRRFAFGVVAVAGPIATMIPPSVIMVIYGILTEQSVAKLLIAGIIPGIVAALVFMAQIYVMVKLNPQLLPRATERTAWKERVLSLKGTWGIIVLAGTIMGGIYSGVFTPTEAGAVGASTAVILALVTRRLNWSNLRDSLDDAIRITAMLFLILACAAVFGYLLAISRIATGFSELIIGAQVGPYWVLAGIILLYLVLGTIIDSITAFIITMPVIFPSVMALGFDPIWFGVLMVHMSEVSLITPPFALNLFILMGIFPDVRLGEMIRGVAPFFIGELVILMLYIAFPQLSLWLPSMMD